MKTSTGNLKVKENLKKQRKIFRYLIIFLVLLSFSGLGILAATLNNTLSVLNKDTDKKSSLDSINGIQNTIDNYKEITTPLETKVSILLLGSDIGYNGRGKVVENEPTRSDTIILAQVDPEKHQVNALSIPRDSRVLIPGNRYYDKINAAFAYGGEQLARKTVANLAGIPIHHYVILKVNGLMNIVDILGGIDIYVEKNMHYVDHTAKLDINLKKGWQHLDGPQAHGYVRFRHDEIGDIGRVQRQQKFVRAVSAKLLNPANIVKLPELVEEVQKNIITDMSTIEMLRIGYFLRKLKKEQIKMVMLPGNFAMIGGVSYWTINDYAAENVIPELFSDSIMAQSKIKENTSIEDEKKIAREKRKYRIAIQNATEDRNLGYKASEILRKEGWYISSIERDSNLSDKTQIILQTGISKQVPALTELLGISPEIIEASIGSIESDYTIVIGKDFADYINNLNGKKININITEN